MISRVKTHLAILICCISTSAGAMVFDNRYVPLLRYPYLFGQSHYTADIFVVTADKSFGENETVVGLPEIFGSYDQYELAKSMVIAGMPNPLPPGLQNVEIPWRVEGNIEGQGIMFTGQQRIIDLVSVGFALYAMRADARHRFFFEKTESFTSGEQQELERDRRSMHQDIGLLADHVQQFGLGDLGVYVRFGHAWDFILKCRHIQAGGSVGFFLPTSEKSNVRYAPSFPFGGNGQTGIFLAADAEFELKEDWKVGLITQFSKRFKKTYTQRVPVNKEPTIFGVVVGQFTVNPGVTFNIAPYVSFENLRNGLGARVQYTATFHARDCWSDARCNPTTPVNLAVVEQHSEWGSDYATLTVFYDFGKVKADREFDPIIKIGWDIPGQWWAGHDVIRTNRIWFGFEFDF